MNSQAGDNRIFVGRNREMSELRGAFDGVLSGRGRLVMLVGEPGIGKTRATQELAAYVESQGLPVLWGRCHEEQGTPPGPGFSSSGHMYSSTAKQSWVLRWDQALPASRGSYQRFEKESQTWDRCQAWSLSKPVSDSSTPSPPS